MISAFGMHRVVITGELDLATAPDVDSAVSGLSARGAQIEINLLRATFIDCAGLGSLLLAAERYERDDCELHVVPPPTSQAAMLWDITRMTEIIPSREKSQGPDHVRTSARETGIER